MKKNKFAYFDQEEKELIESIEAEDSEWKTVDNLEEEIEKLVEAANNTLKQKKKISLRINYEDLIKLKSKAAEEETPYQTLLGSIIHKYNTGQLVLRDKDDDEGYKVKKKRKKNRKKRK